jgi:hypothetical protein
MQMSSRSFLRYLLCAAAVRKLRQTFLSTLACMQHHSSAFALVLAPVLAALGGNLGGVTSWLLGLDGGQLAAQLHADVLIPVLGYKRCLDADNGYGGYGMLITYAFHR